MLKEKMSFLKVVMFLLWILCGRALMWLCVLFFFFTGVIFKIGFCCCYLGWFVLFFMTFLYFKKSWRKCNNFSMDVLVLSGWFCLVWVFFVRLFFFFAWETVSLTAEIVIGFNKLFSVSLHWGIEENFTTTMKVSSLTSSKVTSGNVWASYESLL